MKKRGKNITYCLRLVARKESFGFFSSLFGGSEQASIGSTSPPEVFQGKQVGRGAFEQRQKS